MRFFVFIICLTLVACGGQHCIKIGGSYEGIDGNLEYCFNSEKSEAAGRPVLEASNNKEYTGISTEEAATVLEIMGPASGAVAGVKSASSKPPEKVKDPVRELLRRVKEFKKK